MERATKIQLNIKQAIVGMCLLVVLSFASGYYYCEQYMRGDKIIIKEVNQDCPPMLSSNSSSVVPINEEVAGEDIAKDRVTTRSFVSSKNSNLYHNINCPYVKRIKKENLVWFSTSVEAERKGLKPHSCVK